MLNVAVVLVLAAVAIVVGAIVVAVGRGGELARFAADDPPAEPDFRTAADVAMFRPPLALLGYSVRVADAALQSVASQLADREMEIDALRSEVAALRARARATGAHSEQHDPLWSSGRGVAPEPDPGEGK
jgi:hypothetical protein